MGGGGGYRCEQKSGAPIDVTIPQIRIAGFHNAATLFFAGNGQHRYSHLTPLHITPERFTSHTTSPYLTPLHLNLHTSPSMPHSKPHTSNMNCGVRITKFVMKIVLFLKSSVLIYSHFFSWLSEIVNYNSHCLFR